MEQAATVETIAEGLRDLAVPIDSLTHLPGNPRRGDVEAVARSLRRFGQRKPIVVDANGIILAGNHTVIAARDLLGWTEVAAVRTKDDHAEGLAFALADNRTGTLGGFDDADLAAMLNELDDPELLAAASFSVEDVAALLKSGAAEDSEGAGDEPAATPSLADRFLVPPFSVLDGRSGWWRTRKAQWRALGIRSEVGREGGLISGRAPYDDPGYYVNRRRDGLISEQGRGEHLAYKAVSANPDYYVQKRETEKRIGRTLTNPEFEAEYYQATDRASQAAGTSVFDPVLAELCYRWFSPPAARVLDPWAGGSVRALVASLVNRDYVGIELREEQVAANRAQATVLGPDPAFPPEWILGDSRTELGKLPDSSFDFILGCPPYFDLEKYSDDPRDLSTMSDEEFVAEFRGTIAAAARCLRPDRFAVLVVSAARGKNGMLRDLRGVTVAAAQTAGLSLLNEVVLITPAGSLPFRAARSFIGSRVLGRTHQDVLVFVKGDRKRATDACGDVDPADLEAALSTVVEDDGEAESDA